MGCDIHVHTEVKINGSWRHWGNPSIDRNYRLFSKMAGVRGSETPIVEPRGLPDDVTFETGFDADHNVGHTYSYLTGEEIDILHEWYVENCPDGSFIENEFGYLFGNGWSIKKYQDNYPEGVEDARWIFWFDN